MLISIRNRYMVLNMKSKFKSGALFSQPSHYTSIKYSVGKNSLIVQFATAEELLVAKGRTHS